MPSGLPRTPWTNAAASLIRPWCSAALGGIGGAHPGRLEQLVGLEEVAPLVGRERLVEGVAAVGLRRAAGTPSPGRPGGRSVGTRRAVGGRRRRPDSDADVRPGSSRSSASARRPANPSSSSCHQLDVVLAETPAQPDLAAARERREVDQAGLDVAERDAQLVDPGDARPASGR